MIGIFDALFALALFVPPVAVILGILALAVPARQAGRRIAIDRHATVH